MAFTRSRKLLTSLRLSAQWIATPRNASAAEVVRHMTAMQAQDFGGAKWSIGLRSTTLTGAQVEAALAAGEIVRSWPARGTLHFVAPEDLGWMLRLTSPRQTRVAAGRHRQLELEERDFASATDLARQNLGGGRSLTRTELLELWNTHGISTAGQRGAHLLVHLAQTGVIVFGPVTGKQHSFVLLDEWVANPRRLEREESLAEWGRRYFTSHGPATVRDFAWWASLTLTEAREGLALALASLETLEVDGVSYFHAPGLEPAKAATHLLPGFDEYMLGYQNRGAALDDEHAESIVPGANGMFMPTIVANGHVTGLWKRTVRAKRVDVALEPFGAAPRVDRAIKRYAAFLETAVQCD